MQRATLFCNQLFPAKAGKHPVIAYSAKAKCLDLFLKNKNDYIALGPILGDIFRLPDQIECLLPKCSGSTRFGNYGFQKKVRPHTAASLKEYKGDGDIAGVEASWLAERQVAQGVVFALTASLRMLVKKRADGTICWRQDPVEFFKKHAPSLFEPVTGMDYDNPNALGKDAKLWGDVYLSAYQALHPETE